MILLKLLGSMALSGLIVSLWLLVAGTYTAFNHDKDLEGGLSNKVLWLGLALLLGSVVVLATMAIGAVIIAIWY